MARSLELGMVGAKTGVISDLAMPYVSSFFPIMSSHAEKSDQIYRFGGIKSSGFGREGSCYGGNEYMTIKMVTFGPSGKSRRGSL